MPARFFPTKTTLVSAVALTLMLPMSGCDLAENHLKIDRTTNSEVQDYRDALSPREAAFADDEKSSVAEDGPELQEYVSDDTQSMKAMPLVSISVNQTIPLRDALFELAKQANFDVQLDPRITGSIIFTARNKPFDMVIDRICEIAGLRYKMEDGDTLRIELDTPYSKNYKLDYIAFVRSNKNNIKTKVGISGSGDSTEAETGSQFEISSSAEANFWSELDANLKQILSSNSNGSYLKTDVDPQITLTTSNTNNPNLPPAPPIDESALSEGAATVSPQAGAGSSFVSSPVSLPSEPATSTNTGATTPAPVPAASTPVVPQPVPVGNANAPAAVTPAPAPVLNVESLPASTNATGGASAASPNAVTFTPSYSINKQAGIVSVYANERLHKQINEYLQDVRRATTSQVLIEAKVLEVRLSDEYVAGINWQEFGNSLGDFSVDLNLPTPTMNPDNGLNIFSASLIGNDFGLAVDALSRFGTVHALASPRLTVINNQPAVLSVAKNTVYFELDVTQTTTAGTPPIVDRTVDSEIKTVPEGVLINVLPSIDLDRGQVSMQVRPTVTRIDSFKNDPGVTFLNAGIESAIPELNVQEIDSVVRMKSGQAMVMGGLLEDRSLAEQNGVPVASEVPLLGGLFRSQSDRNTKTELVIFLKATIVNDGEDTVHNTDRELYRTFSKDRRPFKM